MPSPLRVMLLGNLKRGRLLNVEITNGMRFVRDLNGFSEAFGVLERSCKAVWEHAEPWRAEPGFINLVADIRARIQAGCARSGMG